MRPIGSFRKALKVLNRYPKNSSTKDNSWLLENNKNCWVNAYHGTSLGGGMVGILNDANSSNKNAFLKANTKYFGEGVYTSPYPEFALRYTN